MSYWAEVAGTHTLLFPLEVFPPASPSASLFGSKGTDGRVAPIHYFFSRSWFVRLLSGCYTTRIFSISLSGPIQGQRQMVHTRTERGELPSSNFFQYSSALAASVPRPRKLIFEKRGENPRGRQPVFSSRTRQGTRNKTRSERGGRKRKRLVYPARDGPRRKPYSVVEIAQQQNSLRVMYLQREDRGREGRERIRE